MSVQIGPISLELLEDHREQSHVDQTHHNKRDNAVSHEEYLKMDGVEDSGEVQTGETWRTSDLIPS